MQAFNNVIVKVEQKQSLEGSINVTNIITIIIIDLIKDMNFILLMSGVAYCSMHEATLRLYLQIGWPRPTLIFIL